MATIYPTFDPSTRTWFHGRYEAPTIRELLDKMPPGTEIADYYPNGDTPRTDWSLDMDPGSRITLPGQDGTLGKVPGHWEKTKKKVRRQINRRVSKEVKYHRDRKEKKKNVNGVDWWSPQDEAMLKTMVGKGEKTYTEMAAVLCREREAVAGKIDRMRKEGKL